MSNLFLVFLSCFYADMVFKAITIGASATALWPIAAAAMLLAGGMVSNIASADRLQLQSTHH